jgi:hypothetical protein
VRLVAAAIVATSLLIAPAPARAADVASFLIRVRAVQRLGPFAFFAPEFYRLKALVEADGEALKSEYAVAIAEHRSTYFCPPATGKPKVSPSEYLAALDAVPGERRATTTTKDVLRTVLERKYPCQG